jgi:hypothetical protein
LDITCFQVNELFFIQHSIRSYNYLKHCLFDYKIVNNTICIFGVGKLRYDFLRS